LRSYTEVMIVNDIKIDEILDELPENLRQKAEKILSEMLEKKESDEHIRIVISSLYWNWT